MNAETVGFVAVKSATIAAWGMIAAAATILIAPFVITMFWATALFVVILSL